MHRSALIPLYVGANWAPGWDAIRSKSPGREIVDPDARAAPRAVSGTRVSQLLGLLDFAPEILEAIEAAGEVALSITEKKLRVIARMEERKQVREWRLRTGPPAKARCQGLGSRGPRELGSPGSAQGEDETAGRA